MPKHKLIGMTMPSLIQLIMQENAKKPLWRDDTFFVFFDVKF
jgi:hypothetical protein